MKHQYDGVYIDNFKDHYAIFSDSGEKLAEYDTTKDAKEDIPEWEILKFKQTRRKQNYEYKSE